MSQDKKSDQQPVTSDQKSNESNPSTPSNSSTQSFPYIHPQTGMTVARHDANGTPLTATGIDCRPDAPWREKMKPQKKSTSSNQSNPSTASIESTETKPEAKPSTKK